MRLFKKESTWEGKKSIRTVFRKNLALKPQAHLPAITIKVPRTAVHRSPLQRLELIKMPVFVENLSAVKTGAGGDEQIAGRDSDPIGSCAPGQVVGPIPDRFGCFQITNIAAKLFQSRNFLRLRARP